MTPPSGRSWRVHLTIAPIGFVGTFRNSSASGRWFTGQHKAHALGLAPWHPGRNVGAFNESGS